MNQMEQFARKQYINLETFRRNGQGVRTPVWFAQAGEVLYVMTMPSSGKAKRIRNNGCVNIAPCRMDGTLIGEWVSAQARQVTDAALCNEIDRLFNKKYGLLKKLTQLQRKGGTADNLFLEIKPAG